MPEKEDRSAMMLGTPVKKLIPRLAVPTIIAQLITTIYNIVDTYFVSNLGTNATAAVGVNSLLERIITMIGSLIAAGVGSYIARLLGAGKREDAERAMSASFFLGLASGVIIMGAGLLWTRPLVLLMGATEECMTYSIDYAHYVLLAAPAMVGSLVLNNTLRGEGSATYAMVGIGFGGVLNCVLDPIFIFSMEMGVKGASLATAISKVVSFVILLVPYVRRRTNVTLSLRRFGLRRQDAAEVIKIGSSYFFMSIFGIISSIITNNLAGDISTAALAAMSVCNRVMNFPFAVVMGFNLGMQPVVGFSYGAKRFDRVRESVNFCARIALIGALVMLTLLFVFAAPIINIFNKEMDPEVLRLGVLFIRLYALTLPFHCWGCIYCGYFTATGHAKEMLLISMSRQGYCYIPLLLIIPRLFGEVGLASCQLAADIIAMAVLVPCVVRCYRQIRAGEEEQKALESAQEI